MQLRYCKIARLDNPFFHGSIFNVVWEGAKLQNKQCWNAFNVGNKEPQTETCESAHVFQGRKANCSCRASEPQITSQNRFTASCSSIFPPTRVFCFFLYSGTLDLKIFLYLNWFLLFFAKCQTFVKWRTL